MGAIRLFLEWDLTGAEASLTRALDLDPKLAVARAYRSFVYAITKRWPKAQSETTLAVEYEPDSGLVYYLAGAAHYWSRDLDTAAELIERAFDLEPKAVFMHSIRNWILCFNGRAEEAISEMVQAVVASDHHQMLVSSLGVAYARAGRTAEAEELILELKNRSARECIASQWIGEISWRLTGAWKLSIFSSADSKNETHFSSHWLVHRSISLCKTSPATVYFYKG